MDPNYPAGELNDIIAKLCEIETAGFVAYNFKKAFAEIPSAYAGGTPFSLHAVGPEGGVLQRDTFGGNQGTLGGPLRPNNFTETEIIETFIGLMDRNSPEGKLEALGRPWFRRVCGVYLSCYTLDGLVKTILPRRWRYNKAQIGEGLWYGISVYSEITTRPRFQLKATQD